MIFDEITKNEESTFNLGLNYSKELVPGSVVGLIGDLASGKTTFVKGLLRGLEYDYDVTSPTFTLINEYDAKIKVFHIDFYRDSNSSRWDTIGLEEILNSNGIVLIEWADLLLELLPNHMKKIYFEHYQKKYRRIFSK
tara:strand:- start:344 stop:757 length:414 start_codon:yes stop_codon:yes gene_type:complete